MSHRSARLRIPVLAVVSLVMAATLLPVQAAAAVPSNVVLNWNATAAAALREAYNGNLPTVTAFYADLGQDARLHAKYKAIAGKLAARRQIRERYIALAIHALQTELDAQGVKAEISGRPKHNYSIYKKMQHRGVDVDQIYDQLAVRVIVSSVP